MDFNPLHLAKTAFGYGKAAVQNGLHDAGQLITHPIDTVDYMAMNVKTMLGESSWKGRGESLAELFIMPNFGEGPLMSCPKVKPLTDVPVDIGMEKPAELLPGTQSLTANKTGVSVPFTLAQGGDGQMTIRAAAPGTNWGKSGAESATMSVFVDGRYNQDIVLYGGATPTDYKVALGNLGPGKHTITFGYNQKGSTQGAKGITLSSAQLGTGASSGDQAIAEKYQPFIYSRSATSGTENNHTDTPLMMWAEGIDHQPNGDMVIHYSVIHSNEDGGTGADPGLEQSTWGRMTDPDPICDVTVGPDGKVKGVSYEGYGDDNHTFHGQFMGNHPLLRVSTTNNDYSQGGKGDFLFRPQVQYENFGPGQSREDLMDENPLFYKISNEEITREGKVMSNQAATAYLAQEGKPGFKPSSKLEDLRNYLYVEYGANSDQSPVAIEVKLKGSNTWYRSDLGNPDYQVQRAGDGIRTSVALPPGTNPSDVEDIRVLDAGSQPVPISNVAKAFMLSQDYQPEYLKLPETQGVTAPGSPLDVKPQP